MIAAEAGKGMVLVRVIKQRDQPVGVERLVNRRLRRGRARSVLARDVQHQRGADSPGLPEDLLQTDPVVPHAGVGSMTAGQQVGEPAAKTEPDLSLIHISEPTRLLS